MCPKTWIAASQQSPNTSPLKGVFINDVIIFRASALPFSTLFCFAVFPPYVYWVNVYCGKTGSVINKRSFNNESFESQTSWHKEWILCNEVWYSALRPKSGYDAEPERAAARCWYTLARIAPNPLIDLSIHTPALNMTSKVKMSAKSDNNGGESPRQNWRWWWQGGLRRSGGDAHAFPKCAGTSAVIPKPST